MQLVKGARHKFEWRCKIVVICNRNATRLRLASELKSISTKDLHCWEHFNDSVRILGSPGRSRVMSTRQCVQLEANYHRQERTNSQPQPLFAGTRT